MKIDRICYASARPIQVNTTKPEVNNSNITQPCFTGKKLKKGLLALLFPGLLCGCNKQLISKVESSELPEIMVHQFTNGHYTPIPQISKLESNQGTLYMPNLYSGKRYPTESQIMVYSDGTSTFRTKIFLNPRTYVDTDMKQLCIPLKYSDDPMVRMLPPEVQQSIEDCNMKVIDKNCIKGLKKDTNTVVMALEQKIPKTIIDTLDFHTLKNVNCFRSFWKNGDNTILDFYYIKNNKCYWMEDPKLYLTTGDTIRLSDFN